MPYPRGRSTRTWLAISSAVAVAIAALVIGVLVGRAWFRSTDAVPVQGLTRLSLNVEPGQYLSGGFWLEKTVGLQRPSRSSFVLSPDGLNLVYVASDGNTTRLYRRRLDQAQATPIPESEGASSAFFAPDGESVGFVVELSPGGRPIRRTASRFSVGGHRAEEDVDGKWRGTDDCHLPERSSRRSGPVGPNATPSYCLQERLSMKFRRTAEA